MEFIWFTSQDKRMEAAFALRHKVFVQEQGFSAEADKDEKDAVCLHVVGYAENGEPVCTARMYEEHPGVWHAGRIAVLQSCRGTGTGRRLMQAVVKKAAEHAAGAVELGAQHDKAGFYEACGFCICGKPFLDENYLHIPMRFVI